jgi:thiol-disulfide isomerase/thioredoxin
LHSTLRNLTLVLIGFVACAESSAEAATPTPPAPRFALPGRSGETVALDSLDARVVLVDFWASWCVPCRKSFPWMNALREQYGAKGLAIVAINLDKDRAAADAFLAKNPAAFTVAFDPAGQTAEAYRVSGMPSTVLIGQDRTILVRHTGFDSKHAGEIEAAIEEALE